MHIVRFFPIGNADTCLIELANGRRVLFDFADMHNPNDPDDKRCDLEKELRDILGDDKVIDVVAFTHLDRDHCHRAKEIFFRWSTLKSTRMMIGSRSKRSGFLPMLCWKRGSKAKHAPFARKPGTAL